MPNAKTHQLFNMSALTISTGIALNYYEVNGFVALSFIAGNVFSTYFYNPDTDLSYSRPNKNLPFFLRIFFKPYSYFIKHRSPISHSLLLSSVFRILYLSGVGLVLFGLYQKVFGNSLSGESIRSFFLHLYSQKTYLVAAFLGLCFADFCHIFLDVVFSKTRV